MFSHQQINRIQESLPDFTLDKICSTTSINLPAIYSYLEFYGFLHTLKGLPVEYYNGYRHPQGSASRWGRIATHFWRHSNAKGTVLLIHGLFDHVGLFQPLIRRLLNQNLSVIAIDLPGHGLSDGDETVIDDFASYASVVEDTRRYFRNIIEGPFVGMGQSTGAAILLHQAFSAQTNNQPPPYDRLVLCAPLVRPKKYKFVSVVYYLLRPFISRVSRRFTENTHDESFNYFLSCTDILQSQSLSVRWVGAMRQWVKEFDEQPEIIIPTLLLQGTSDNVVDWKWNIRQIEKHMRRLQLVYIEDAMHHLANEPLPWSETIEEHIKEFLRSI